MKIFLPEYNLLLKKKLHRVCNISECKVRKAHISAKKL